jgi:O-antigen/teichoic acid export membrane protein
MNQEDTSGKANRSSTGQMFGRGMGYSLVFAVQAASSILVTPIITRSIGVAQFGLVANTLTVAAVVLGLAGMSTQVGVQRHFADEDGDRETRFIVAIVAIISALVIVIAILLIPEWAGLVGMGHSKAVLEYGLGWGGIYSTVSILSAVLRSQDRLSSVITLATVQVVSSQFVGLLFVFIFSRTAEMYFKGMFFGQLAALLLGIILVKPWPSRIKWSHLVAVYGISLPLLLHGLSVQVLNLGDRVVVQRDLGPISVAHYQLAYSTSAVLMMILSILNGAWEPRLFETREFVARRLMLSGLRDGVFRLLAPAILGVILAAPIVLHVLAPPSYNTNALGDVVLVVTFSAVPYAWYASNMRLMLTFRNTRSIYWVAPLCAAANVALNIVLVPAIGIVGSALATLLAYSLLAALVGLQGRRHIKLPPITQDVWLPMIVVLCGCGVLSFVPYYEWIELVRLFLALAAGLWAIRELRALMRQPNDTRDFGRYRHARSR